jgi:hypothetical protein
MFLASALTLARDSAIMDEELARRIRDGGR